MGIVKNIEDKIKLAYVISIGSFITSIVTISINSYFKSEEVKDARRSIYVMDNTNVPLLANRSSVDDNRPVEYKAHVDLFHNIFFTLTPDDKQIQYQMDRAMYLIDETGAQQYNNLKEKGYFNQILSSSAVLSIQTDSIFLDMGKKYFKFYGRQTIERKSSTTVRSLVTEGYLKDIPRSTNNPHGILIMNWKTVENKDISNNERATF